MCKLDILFGTMTPASPFATGDLRLIKNTYTPEQRKHLLSTLIDGVAWNEDFHVVAGRRFNIPRLQAWCADEGIHYRYADNLLRTQPWITPLLDIRRNVEDAVGHRFNAVLLTYYRNGEDSVGWHADDERELGAHPVIASLSLGAARQFEFRHKRGAVTDSVTLYDGDLVLMLPGFQQEWEHRVPGEPAVREPRLNLTFRNVEAPQ